MEWLCRMNEALRYIEANLRGSIDYREAARIACASLTRFQRMFTFMTDLTVGDYVRCRKMFLAAQDLKNSDIKVIDLALRYGYDSPEAFTRAFRAFHGAPPTAVRRLGVCRSYPPISFQINISGGNMMMGTKPLIQMEELSGMKAVMFRAHCPEPERQAWNEMRGWALKNLQDYEVRRYFGFAPFGHHPNGPGEEAHDYCALMLLHGAEGDCGELYGAKVTDAPGGLFLAGDVALNEYQEDGRIDIGLSMKNASQIIYESMLNMGGYELDFDGRTYLEEHVFQKEWFTARQPEQFPAEYRFWLPVKKKP